MPETTETSLLDGLPRLEWAPRAGVGSSQALEREMMTQQPRVPRVGLAKIPIGSLGHGSLGWEVGQSHLEPPHTLHPQWLLRVSEVGITLAASSKATEGHREGTFVLLWEMSWVARSLRPVGRGC